MNLPDPLFNFTHKNDTFQAGCDSGAYFKENFFTFFVKKFCASQGLQDCFAPLAKRSREHGPRKLAAEGG
ncbi:MAG: hypothetical protein HQL86_04530 [Magnetococcales bacterium]|nr:hypothetical protein [Magnetococcales bacterium]